VTPADARLSAGGLLTQFRRTSLTVKLTALGAVVTALVVFGAFWALSVQTRRSARALFAEELTRHQTTLLRLQRQNLNQVIASAGVMTQTPTLRSALQTYRVESDLGDANPQLVRTVEAELERLLRSSDRDLVLVTNEQGVVFATAYREEDPNPRALMRGVDLSRLPAVRRAISPTAAADSGSFAVFRRGGVAYELVVHPLVLDGYTLGALVLGERLDNGLVASARAAFDGQVVVTVGSSLVAGTLTDSTLGRRLVAMRDGATRTTLRVGRVEYVAAPLPLGDTQQGEPAALWLMQPIDETVRALTSPLLRQFVIYGLLAVALATLGAAMATRSVLRPFHAFVAYLRSGDPTNGAAHRFDSEGQPREIETLNESFQQLMDSIDVKRKELVRRTTELTAANAVLSDEIRERERVESALLERDEQLRQSQKLEAIGTLAGGIAHDFNNLLTAMSGFSQLALMKTDPKSPVVEDLQQILEAANRASHLTKQLLAFSRKQVLRPAVLDVGNVICGIAPLFERLLGEQVKLRLAIEQGIPPVLADQGQLEQVLMNLAINARDAMPSGGVLTIAAAATSVHGDACAEVTVSDNGVGIPEHLRERIFEPFFTTKEPGKGTGLGLSTVYGIVTQSGGRIEVDSTEGIGTTFRLTLPAAKEEVLQDEGQPPLSSLPRGTETILLVEDESAVRNLARRTLESCGYTVLPASDPIEALHLAETARVDLVLSDIRMPHMTGTEMIEQFLLEHPAPVVVFMSGYAEEALMAESRSLRSSFIRKPFTPTALACTIREALDASLHSPVIALP
jgi:signal transduction histidine kinase